MKLEVGQKLWFSAPRYRTSRYVEITKVGREYAHISEGAPNYRFRLSDRRMAICTNGSDSGRCYYSKEEHDAEIETDKLWRDFKNACSYSPPQGTTAENIREAARILGIKI